MDIEVNTTPEGDFYVILGVTDNGQETWFPGYGSTYEAALAEAQQASMDSLLPDLPTEEPVIPDPVDPTFSTGLMALGAHDFLVMA